jgi:stearoyl-CoA 9-desaturase NADPH oxidoreductase
MTLAQPHSGPIRARPLAPWARRVLGSRLVEALASPHGVSRYLELLSPLWSLDQKRAVVTQVTRETADTVTLSLLPGGTPPTFRAGQFVQLGVEVGGVRHTRCYSVSCSEGASGAGPLQVTVKAHSHGLVSRFLNEHATPGMVVGLTPPTGDFTLPTPRPPHLLLISGGSGITPVMSMLRTLCDEGHDGRVTFLHYARSREDVIFGGDLERLAAAHTNVSLVTVFTRSAPGPHSRGLYGHFHAGHLAALGVHDDAEVYVCGPEGLIAGVRAACETDGRGGRLHVERFELPAAPAVPEGAVTGRIRFLRSGVTVDNDGRSLLEQAESAGLTPEHGCRMGICHTCVRPLEAGEVRDIRTGARCAQPGVDVQLCVHAPVGDVAVDL